VARRHTREVLTFRAPLAALGVARGTDAAVRLGARLRLDLLRSAVGVRERRFVARSLEGEMMAPLVREFDISCKTGCK
jgi:hypothetical protein